MYWLGILAQDNLDVTWYFLTIFFFFIWDHTGPISFKEMCLYSFKFFIFLSPSVSFFFFFFFRLLKKEENFIFIPRSREELPENFPKEIPGICYFLEVRSGQKQPKSSITSARVRKVSYNIGTMFLRETSL